MDNLKKGDIVWVANLISDYECVICEVVVDKDSGPGRPLGLVLCTTISRNGVPYSTQSWFDFSKCKPCLTAQDALDELIAKVRMELGTLEERKARLSARWVAFLLDFKARMENQ